MQKVKTSNYQSSVKISCKVNTGSNSNILPFVYTKFYALDWEKAIGIESKNTW